MLRATQGHLTSQSPIRSLSLSLSLSVPETFSVLARLTDPQHAKVPKSESTKPEPSRDGR